MQGGHTSAKIDNVALQAGELSLGWRACPRQHRAPGVAEIHADPLSQLSDLTARGGDPATASCPRLPPLAILKAAVERQTARPEKTVQRGGGTRDGEASLSRAKGCARSRLGI